MQLEAFTDFARKITTVRALGGRRAVETILTGAVGEEKTREILSSAPRTERIAKAVAGVQSKDLANILQEEQASVAALLLGLMPAEKASEIVGFFEADFRTSVIKRLSSPRDADAETMQRIEAAFMKRVTGISTGAEMMAESQIGGPEMVASLLKTSKSEVKDEVMEQIEADEPEAAEKIRELIFTFDDLGALSDDDIQKVLREVSMDKLVVALKKCESAVREKLTSNLSKRARENLQEEEELLGKVKLSEVETEQKNIVAIVESMADAGEISVGGGGEEDEYV
jgi:flagellar motor switch protein FliG